MRLLGADPNAREYCESLVARRRRTRRCRARAHRSRGRQMREQQASARLHSSARHRGSSRHQQGHHSTKRRALGEPLLSHVSRCRRPSARQRARDVPRSSHLSSSRGSSCFPAPCLPRSPRSHDRWTQPAGQASCALTRRCLLASRGRTRGRAQWDRRLECDVRCRRRNASAAWPFVCEPPHKRAGLGPRSAGGCPTGLFWRTKRDSQPPRVNAGASAMATSANNARGAPDGY